MARFAPAPIVAPRGLAGTFDDYQPGAVLNTSRLRPNTVLLNVYDVGDNETVNKINEIFTGSGNVLLAGIFHGGVEVFGEEWSYGFCEEGRTGVCMCHPRLHPQHSYKNTTVMGETSLSKAEIKAVLERMQKEWPGSQYNLIHNNCINFCNAFLAELGLRRVPGWVDRAARAASNVNNAVQSLQSIRAEDVQGQVLQVGGLAAEAAVDAIDAVAALAGNIFALAPSPPQAPPPQQQRRSRPAAPAPSANQLMYFVDTAGVKEESAKPGRAVPAVAQGQVGAAATRKAAVKPAPAPVDMLDLLGDGPSIVPSGESTKPVVAAAPAPLFDLLGDDFFGGPAAQPAGQTPAPVATSSPQNHAPLVGFDLLA